MKPVPSTKVDTSVVIAGIRLANPVLAASGTYGYGTEYRGLSRPSDFGAVITKTVTLEHRAGNPPPRICETPAGMLNSIGLANVGIERFLAEKLPALRRSGTVIFANIAGKSLEEYARLAAILDQASGISAVEVNVSCPNVARGGIAFGADPPLAARLTKAVRCACRKPIIVKLSPNVSDMVPIAKAVAGAGADALSLINTLYGLAIDIQKRRPLLGNDTGGLSGPAIRPVALYHVYRVSRAVKIPVIGLGGILSADDAIQFLLAGASAVQIGTANFVDPAAPGKIVKGLISYCRLHGLNSVRELTGWLAS
jgi:dihydroorotate dehydrogenase (NAD+) catalytic subunit